MVYGVWPTWERTQLRELMAGMLEAYREYFFAIRESYMRQETDMTPEIDEARQKARLARSNMEASVGRFQAEPRASERLVASWTNIMATSHRMIHAVMALEAGLTRSTPAPPRKAFPIRS